MVERVARRADGVRFIKHHLGLSGWSVVWAAGVVRGGVIGSGIRATRREIVGEKGDDELQSAFECACAVQFLHGGERHRFEQLDTGLAIRRVHAVQLHEVHEEIDRHAFAGTKGGGYMQRVLRVYFSPGFPATRSVATSWSRRCPSPPHRGGRWRRGTGQECRFSPG